mgnify:CR=1 FL=1
MLVCMLSEYTVFSLRCTLHLGLRGVLTLFGTNSSLTEVTKSPILVCTPCWLDTAQSENSNILSEYYIALTLTASRLSPFVSANSGQVVSKKDITLALTKIEHRDTTGLHGASGSKIQSITDVPAEYQRDTDKLVISPPKSQCCYIHRLPNGLVSAYSSRSSACRGTTNQTPNPKPHRTRLLIWSCACRWSSMDSHNYNHRHHCVHHCSLSNRHSLLPLVHQTTIWHSENLSERMDNLLYLYSQNRWFQTCHLSQFWYVAGTNRERRQLPEPFHIHQRTWQFGPCVRRRWQQPKQQKSRRDGSYSHRPDNCWERCVTHSYHIMKWHCDWRIKDTAKHL